MGWFVVVLILFGVFVVPFVVGGYLAKKMRLQDYGWRIGLILCSVLAAACVISVAMRPEKPIQYAVQQDDTLKSIATKYDVPIQTIVDENNIASTQELAVGKELRIPKPKRLRIKQGIDLSGGVILIYEIDDEQSVAQASAGDGSEDAVGSDGGGSQQVDVNALVEALARRINPGGVKEVVIRPYGERQVEIIIPEVDDAEISRIKKSITSSGFLKFLILARAKEHKELFDLADAQPNARLIKDGDRVVGEWVRLARTDDGSDFKVPIDETVNKYREPQPGVREVLMARSLFQVEGRHLSSVRASFDESLNPSVDFTMTTRGAALFGGLTGTHLPDPTTNLSYRLGIIMDGELISAPTIQSTISDRGTITGRFSQEEVDFLVNVLRAGRLPAVLKDPPISESQISPLLGIDTIRKGKLAIGSSIVAVLLFMLVYYRFAGVVACLALVLNLMLILAMMILIGAAFTLPGLAGLVLTVGMSVDANVLIFERIREEMRKGAALRMAIRNGFGRATTTIVDANITTLITALVLYGIGTDQIRGFAVTLILGILMSMFTAIFCSRVVFDIAERKRFIKQLTMTQLLSEPKLNLIGMRKIAGACSLVLVLIGLAAVALRGPSIFDIDFRGGTSVQAMLNQPLEYSEVFQRVKELPDITLTQMNPEGIERNTVYKFDTSLQVRAELEKALTDTFRDDAGQSLFVSHSVEYDTPVLVARRSEEVGKDKDAADLNSGAPAGAPTGSAEESDNATTTQEDSPDVQAETEGSDLDAIQSAKPETDVTDAGEESSNGGQTDSDAADAEDGARRDLPSDTLLAYADEPELRLAQVPAGIEGNSAESSTNNNASLASQAVAQTKLRFDDHITRDTLMEAIRAATDSLGIAEPNIELTGPQGQADSARGFKEWNVQAATTVSQLESILSKIKTDLEGKPAWLSSSTIGGAVAGDTTRMAIAAIVTSLICIVGYIWIRFQRVIFGLAAVVALVHDVLITLGAVALSLWLSKALGFLMIDEFKISLPVVAAFLTIIGYSLNDTIVVFDRIREVRGRSPDIAEEMINTSINQTLSRTILTSLTTLLVILILYTFGGQGIHGFAFALLIGVVVGTYSSIFIASPALLWMGRRHDSRTSKRDKVAA